MSIVANALQAWNSKLGSRTDFRDYLALPNLASLLVIILIDVSRYKNFSAITPSILLMGYAWIASVYIYQRRNDYSFRLAFGYLSTLFVLAAVVTVIFRAAQPTWVFEVLALLLASTALARLPLSFCFFVSVLAAAIGVALSYILNVNIFNSDDFLTGILFLTVSALALFFSSFLRSNEETWSELDSEVLLKKDLDEEIEKSADYSTGRIDLKKIDLDHEEQLVTLAYRFISREALSDFAWRLPVICILISAFAFGATFLYEVDRKDFGLNWLSIALVQVVLHFLLLQRVTLGRVYAYSFVIALGTIAWWGLLPLLGVGPTMLHSMLLAVVILGIGSMPWPERYNIALALVFILITVLRASFIQYPVVVSLITLFLIVIAARSGALARMSFMARSSAAFLAQWTTRTVSALSMVRLLTTLVTLTCDGLSALLLIGDERAERINKGKIEPTTVDPLFVRGLVQKVEEHRKEQGLLSFTRLGEQFRPACNQWFGYVPSEMIFLRLTAVIDEEERWVTLVIPVSFGSRFAGLRRTRRSVVGIVSLVKVALAAARSRFITTDTLVASQRSISEQEGELNQLIHNVNNIAQDISIHCDNIRTEMKSDLEQVDEESNALINKELEYLESASRTLAAGVSDVKLLKELLRIKRFDRVENVKVKSLVDEIEIYGKYRTYRRNQKFELNCDLDSECGVSVASREFLETALRVLVRIASSRLEHNGVLKFEAKQEEGAICFYISYSGDLFSSNQQDQVYSSTFVDSSESRMISYLRAVVNLARLSNGSFQIDNNSGASQKFILKLPAAKLSNKTHSQRGQWVLLVDDNPEVTTFYSRVAEALSLKYYTAASVPEAEVLVEEQGRPRLVITDIQLGNSSGLDLVGLLRDKFGKELPVIVVSGDTDDSVPRRVKEMGVTKHLTKPVGKRRLFAEIRELL